jgi:hypothetical protein
MGKGKDGQIWYVDFIFGLIIFTVALVIATRYVSNNYYMNSEKGDMVTETAKGISEDLMGDGIPPSWSPSSVVSIGLTDGDYILNRSKAESFLVLARGDYSMAKGILRSPFDFLVVFRDRNNEPVNVGGTCAIGSPDISPQFNLSTFRAAYYFHDSSAEYMHGKMAGLGADIYSLSNISSFFGNLTNYDVAVMESPRMDDLGALTPSYVSGRLRDFCNKGGVIIMDGQVNTEILNASNKTRAILNGVATVNEPSAYINFTALRDIRFYTTNYMARTNASQNYRAVANYSDGTPAISSWDFGNGKVFYFSDWNNAQGDDILADVYQTVLSTSAGRCQNLSVSSDYEDISMVPRFVVLRSPAKNASADIIKMEVYAWQR